MKKKWHILIALIGFLAGLLDSSASQAQSSNRFSLAGGVMFLSNPSRTAFDVGAEFEHRADSFIGYGGQANYLFSDPSIGLLGAPMVFLHPIASDWFISAAPLFQVVTGSGLSVGGRFGTRIPLTFGFLSFIPSATVDFVNGGRIVSLALGVQI
jgi:hypothetical protein